MQESTVTIKGQTTLPKAVRAALGIAPGDRVRYVIDGADVRIIPVRSAADLAGSVAYDGPPVSLDDMDEAIAASAGTLPE